MQLSAQQHVRIPWMETTSSNGWESDGTFVLREQFGTAFIKAGGGVSYRYGRNLPPSMQVNGNHEATYGLGLLEKKAYTPAAPSYFVCAEAYLDYVARDITIDGGVFHHFEQTCSREPWQAEIRMGIGVSYQGIDYFVGGVYCTDSYRRQQSNSFYGTFSIGWNW